ncbi:MAG TPA: Fe-S cluster assembly ATPase SufC [Acidimicrobiales bacterium]|nr:Fe-S cluster assembly ATPase SufC [Acidimicrobiales bacterium]
MSGPGSRLVIDGLTARVAGKEILRGVDLELASGQVHAVMGPNGSGKSTLSHVLLGRPGYEVTGGRVTLDGQDVLGMATWERAQAGLFLGMQYPIEVPGVSLDVALQESFRAGGRDSELVGAAVTAEAERVGLNPLLLGRSMNVDLSGGERKRTETIQLAVLRPKFAILDEIDSGLDIDALRAVSRRVEAATEEFALGVLAITHYTRLLRELRPDHVHVLSKGRIVSSGGPELAEQLESSGYAEWADDETPPGIGATGSGGGEDPFADPFA